MEKFTRNLIEYVGLERYAKDTCNLGKTPNVKQSNIDLKLSIPKCNPKIEQLMRVKVDSKIIKTKVVRTPTGTSLEGQVVTGYKVLVMADIILKITYVALNDEQSVHTFTTVVPFCQYVVMPKDFNTLGVVTADLYVEDVYLEQCDCTDLYGSLVVLAVVEPCTTKRREANV